MFRSTPSSQLLRYLVLACRASQGQPLATLSCQNATRSLRKSPQNSLLQPLSTRSQLSTRAISTTAPSPSHSPRSFASESPSTTPSGRISQQPDLKTHYTLFPQTLPNGPPPTGPFTIPLRLLRTEFLALQATHHPDKAPPGTTYHKHTLALSTLINTAYKTLIDPLLRAQYLLAQTYAIDVTSEDNSTHQPDQDTLMKVMDVQEDIEDATEQSEIDALKMVNQARMEATLQKLANAFEADDPETAKNECVRLKYWRSLQEGLESWEPGKEVRLIH